MRLDQLSGSSSWQAVTGNAAGLGNNSFFVNVKTAGILPANFTAASGSGGVKTAINGTAGSIGYVSPDFVLPIDGSGPKAANLQTWATFSSGAAPVFKAPIAKAGTPIVGATKAPSFAKNLRHPGAGLRDRPAEVGRDLPEAGVGCGLPDRWLHLHRLYTCYATAADADAVAGASSGSLGYLRWFFGSAGDNASKVKTSLTSNGFSLIRAAGCRRRRN